MKKINGQILLFTLIFLVLVIKVTSDQTWMNWIEKFQTFVAGVLAILAAGIALYAAIRAARIQVEGQVKAIQEQIAASQAQELRSIERDRLTLRTVFNVAANNFRDNVIGTKSLLAPMMKNPAGVAKEHIAPLRLRGADALNVEWRELGLLGSEVATEAMALHGLTDLYQINLDITAESVSRIPQNSGLVLRNLGRLDQLLTVVVQQIDRLKSTLE